MELIELKGVTKEFNKVKVLNNVNLHVEEGDLFGIIGQSGSGKTTLLNVLAGFIEPTNGSVTYVSKIDHLPKNLHTNFHKIKRHIGFNPQHPSFYPKLTVKENILHFGQLYGLKRDTLINNAKSLLMFTQLYDHRDKLAQNLSGGMQKRLDISCSLIHKPKILFLDEPTSDLDPVMQTEVVQLINEVNKQGVTIVIASHHLDSVEKICNKLAIIHHGEVHSYGDFEEVRKPFLKEQVNINIKTGKDKERIIQFAKTLPVSKIVDKEDYIILYPTDTEKTMSMLTKMIKEENLYLHDIDLRKPSLNEVFIKITEDKK